MQIIQYIIRDEQTGCHFTGGHQTIASARKSARRLVREYGAPVLIVATVVREADGLDEKNIERVSEGAWR